MHRHNLAPDNAGLIMPSGQGARTGRLLAYSPATEKTTVVASEFLFPNGVAVAPDGEYVIMAETGANRLWKIWVHGAKVNLLGRTCEQALDQDLG